MNQIIQLANASENDLVDRIAEALPMEVRADYYRELRHCRSLPENDEMLRILRIMQFLTLLIHTAPSRRQSTRAYASSSCNPPSHRAPTPWPSWPHR